MYSYSVVAIRQFGAFGDKKDRWPFHRGAGVSTVNLSVFSCVQFDKRKFIAKNTFPSKRIFLFANPHDQLSNNPKNYIALMQVYNIISSFFRRKIIFFTCSNANNKCNSNEAQTSRQCAPLNPTTALACALRGSRFSFSFTSPIFAGL